MFLLDTDHLVIVQRDIQPEANRLRQRMAGHSPSDFYLSVNQTLTGGEIETLICTCPRIFPQ